MLNIVVISDSNFIKDESKIVNQLFDAGLDYFHIKKKSNKLSKFIHLIEGIDKKYHKQIVLHRHFSLVSKYKLFSAHLTNKHRLTNFKTWLLKKYLKLKHRNIHFTMSYHSLESVDDDKFNYEYCFLSPIFGSSTNKYQPGFDFKTLQSILRRSKKNIFALGGITKDNIEEAKKLGFKGVVLSNSVWKSENPIETFEKAMEVVNRVNQDNHIDSNNLSQH